MGLRKRLKRTEDKSASRQCSNKCLPPTRSDVAVTSLRGYIPDSRFFPKKHFNVGYSCYHPKTWTQISRHTLLEKKQSEWKRKRDLVILKFEMRKKSVKSEWERTGIKRSNGGYNQREKESPKKQKQKMKSKNFKKREKWNEKKDQKM